MAIAGHVSKRMLEHYSHIMYTNSKSEFSRLPLSL